MAESEQILWTYVKLKNIAEIYSARIYSRCDLSLTSGKKAATSWPIGFASQIKVTQSAKLQNRVPK